MCINWSSLRCKPQHCEHVHSSPLELDRTGLGPEHARVYMYAWAKAHTNADSARL